MDLGSMRTFIAFVHLRYIHLDWTRRPYCGLSAQALVLVVLSVLRTSDRTNAEPISEFHHHANRAHFVIK